MDTVCVRGVEGSYAPIVSTSGAVHHWRVATSYIQTGPGSILLYIALMLSRQSSNLQCLGSTSGPSINTRSRVPGLQRVADGEYDMTRQGESRPQSAMGSC